MGEYIYNTKRSLFSQDFFKLWTSLFLILFLLDRRDKNNAYGRENFKPDTPYLGKI